MQNTCSKCSATFEVTDEDLEFYEKISPVFNGKKYLIPPPALCPEDRRRRRLAFRNENAFYKRECDLCKKHIVSAYSEDKPHKVYCYDCWWSDQWDGMDFGKDFDFSRPFFDQFSELMLEVPRLGIINAASENSDYCRYGYGNKDCYLLTTSDDNEKCYFGCYVWSSYECVDCQFLIDSKYCYECLDGDSLYECQHCIGCVSCQDCFGCIDSRNLKNCFGCVGLVKKEYCIYNEQLSKKDYKDRIKEKLKNRDSVFKKIKKLSATFPRRANVQINCENTVGDHLKNCKNVYQCFDGYGAEDSKWIVNFPGGVKNSYDFDGCTSLEWCAEGIAVGRNAYMCFASDHIFGGRNNNVYHSSFCIVNSDIFGCVGIRNKKHCVLNKQYTKEEYEELVPKIIEHMKESSEWGEFYPIRISPFGYNETAANQIFPMTKKDVLANGWKWINEKPEKLDVEKVIPAKKLPADIQDIPDDILNWAITCAVSGKPFKITKQELSFYRERNIPIPHSHPEERHKRRLSLRNPQKLWEIECKKCGEKMQTTYAPDRPETVFCEECYLAEVY